jgi:N4-gp56 family major capsid protein
MAITQRYADITAEQVDAYYDMRLLTVAAPNLVYAMVAQDSNQNNTIPEHNGDVINMRRYTALAAATTPLVEGVTPPSTDVSVTSITATVSEYGAWISFTGKLDRLAIDPNLQQYAYLLGMQAGLTIDTLSRDVAVATDTIVYPGSHDERTDITANLEDRFSATLLMKALRTLHDNNALPFANGNFIAIISPSTEFDIMQDSTLVNIMKDAQNRGPENPLVKGYIGSALGVDFYRTSNAKYYTSGGASSNDIHATMIFGQNAIGAGGLAGYIPAKISGTQTGNDTGKKINPVKLIVTPVETPSKEDPLHQRGTVGWLTTYVAKLLNEDFLVKCEHGVSA